MKFLRFFSVFLFVFPLASFASHGEDFCELYPITLPHDLVASSAENTAFNQVPLGYGKGSYNWLTWSGKNDANTIAASLNPPGNSNHYINPLNTADHLIEENDWVQGSPGVNNSRNIRDNLNALLGKDIIIPFWSQYSGQGSQFNYQVQQFGVIQIQDYKLNGKGYLSFKFQGFTHCYNQPPVAHDSNIQTQEDVVIDFSVLSDDEDGDQLNYNVLTQPQYGVLAGSGPNYNYKPQDNYFGQDSFTFKASDGKEDSNIATVSINIIAVNDKPIAEDMVLNGTEDMSLSIDLIASDSDNNTLVYQFISQPTNGRLSGILPNLIYVPNNNFNGTDNFTFLVNDGEYDSNTATVNINIEGVNDAPEILSSPITSVDENSAYLYGIIATDADFDVLSYTLSSNPTGMIIDPDGVVSWTPSSAQVGEHSVTIVVTDSNDLSVTQTYIIEVLINTAPVAQDLSIDTEQNTPVAFLLEGIDSPSQTLSYRVIEGPNNGTIFGESPNLIYLPNSFYYGEDRIEFLVDDGFTQSQIGTVNINVVRTEINNHAPRFISKPKSPLLLVAGDGRPETLDLRNWTEVHQFSSDSLTGGNGNWIIDPIEMTVIQTVNGGANALVSDFETLETQIEGQWIVETTGDDDFMGFVFGFQNPYQFYVFSWKQGTQGTALRGMEVKVYDMNPDGSEGKPQLWNSNPENGRVLFRNDIPWLDNTLYDFSLSMGNGRFTITVTQGNKQLDSFTVIDDTFVSGRFGFYNQSQNDVRYSGFTGKILSVGRYSYPVRVVDPDGDSFTISLLQGPQGMSFDPTSSTLIWDSNLAKVGSYEVILEAIDIFGSSSKQAFDLVVVDEAPAIVSTAKTTAIASSIYGYNVFAIDPTPNDQLQYSLSVAPNEMTIDLSSGLIQWLPADFDVGIHNIIVKVTDINGNSDEQAFLINVIKAELNDAPEFISFPLVQVEVGKPYNYMPVTIDANGDEVQYSLVKVPYGMQMFDGKNITWRAASDQIGRHQIILEAIDDKGASTRQVFTVDVVMLGYTAPVFISEPILHTEIGVDYQYSVEAFDADGDEISYELLGAPTSMTIDELGIINWVPDSFSVGTHSITIRAVDTFGLFTEQQYFLTIIEPTPGNLPPIITSKPDVITGVGEDYVYQIIASDPNDDLLNYLLVDSPVGMNISSEGLITWKSIDVGLEIIKIQVVDNNGGRSSQSFFLAVRDSAINNLPIFTSSPILTVELGGTYLYDADAIDADGDSLNYALTMSPEGMTIESSSGMISWIPTLEQFGEHSVIIQVSDSLGGSALQSFVINVLSHNLNRAPSISSQPGFNAKIFNQYLYQVKAVDPDGDALTYSFISSPAGMSISESGLIDWMPTELQMTTISVRVSDGDKFVEQGWNLKVIDVDAILSAEISASPTYSNEGDTVLIQVTPINAVGSVAIALKVDGVDVVVDNSYQADVVASGMGTHIIEATISDQGSSVVEIDNFYVKDPNDTTVPVAKISTPSEGQEITALTEIIATVTDDNLANWKIYYRAKNVEAAAQVTTPLILLAKGNSNVTEQVITTFDPSMLFNGLFELVLKATDINGAETLDFKTIRVTGDLKVGNFSITLEDLNIPLAGIPIRVTRTYDSRQKDQELDFGYGWSVSYQDVKINESRIPGSQWTLNEYPSGPLGIIPNYCVEPLGSPMITVTLPSGKVESFEVAATPTCSQASPILDVALDFKPVDDTFSTLKAVEQINGRLVNGEIIDTTSIQALNPNRYTLTTRAGYIYHLDQSFGVTSIDDPNGNTLTYSDSGIVHSSGKSVSFVRDANGRITQVIDPKGNAIQYAYDALGNLNNVTDAVSATVNFTYNASHHLLDIIDPLGRNVVRNIYDDSGRLIAQQDSDGNRTDFNHDLAGKQSTVTDRLGRISILYYDDEGNVTSQVNALNGVTSFTFDSRGNQLTKVDPLGRNSSATYSLSNDQLTQVDGLNSSIEFTYNTRGQELTIKDESGDLFTNIYDQIGNLVSITDPQGNVVSNNINPQGLPALTRDALNNETTYTYDTDGNKLTETNPLGEVTIYSYDSNNNTLSETRARTLADASVVNETDSFKYDKRDRVIESTNALGQINSTEFNLVGNQVATVDALNRRTEFDYDVYGRLTETRYPDGTKTNKSYDAEGNLLSETDRLNRVTVFVYDNLNRVTKTTFADGSIVQTEYDVVGQVVAEIDANANRTEHVYDLAGRRIKTTDALGNEHQFAYDVDGNLINETDAKGHKTTYIYDNLDRKIQTSFANNSNVKTGFDKLARKTSATDQANVSTSYSYDALGRLISVTDVQGNVTSFTFDEAGNKLTQTDAEGRTTSWTYDSLGRVLTRTLPLGQVETSTYDALGNLLTHIDFNGELTTYIYDINNRMTLVTYDKDSSTESFTYDATGNQLTAVSAQGVWTYTYDVMNRLASETKPNGEKLEYLYDSNGNKTQLKVTYVGGAIRIENSTYDALNRLETVTDADGNKTTYGYDAVGNRTSVTHSNANITAYVYDELNRLTQMQDKRADDLIYQQFDYTLHVTGRRLKIEELSGRISSYTYDSLYRLTNEAISDFVNGNYSAEYQFDKVGNRIYSTINGVSTAYTYDVNDRLKQEGGEVYTYDDNGNTLSKSIDSDITTYTYDVKQKLVFANILEGGVTRTSNYRYNMDGIRSQKVEDGVITNYLVDSNRAYAQVIAETDSANTIQVEYMFGDDLLAQKRGSTLSNYKYDGLGSTRALTDSTGTVTDEYFYDAFGVTLASTGSTENDYLFTGEQFDAGLGNYYLRARYYNQGVGRFTQQDSWTGNNSDPITLHKYLYANADPVRYTDPTGNFGLAGASVANNIVGILTQMQIDNALTLLGEQGVDVSTEKTAVLILGIASLGNAGIKLLKMFTRGRGIPSVTFSPATNKGPLPMDVIRTFRSGTYTQSQLTSSVVLYRVFGGKAGQFRKYWSRTRPNGPVQNRIDSALLDEFGNTQSGLVSIRVPKGQVIYEGAVAPQTNGVQTLLGGGNQIYLPSVDPSWAL